MSILNPDGKIDVKLKFAFRLYDFDEDGKIGFEDLKKYLNAVTLFDTAAAATNGDKGGGKDKEKVETNGKSAKNGRKGEKKEDDIYNISPEEVIDRIARKTMTECGGAEAESDPTVAFIKLEDFANKVFEKVQKNNRTRYIALCDYLKSEYGITVKDVIPEEDKPFSKIYKKNKKELLLSDYSSLETKKLHAAAQIAQEGANKEIDDYLSKFTFPSEESKNLTKVALLNYCGAAILMPYKLFHNECKKLKYDLELLQNTFATSFEQVAHRVTCLQDPKLPGIPFHFLRVDMAGNISKRFSLSGIEIPRYGGACPRWNVYSALTRPGVIQAAVSKMTNGEKYVCIARTVEKGIGRFGQSKSILSIGLGCEAKYAKDFVYTENININDKSTEIPIGVSCRTCDRLDCSQRAFPPLHKKFDVDINSRGVSVYVGDKN